MIAKRWYAALRIFLANLWTALTWRQIHSINEHIQRLTTEREDAEKRASTDELTGLNNRHKFLTLAQSRIEEAKRNGGQLSLMFFDVKKFKTINDTYGHQTGDQVLQSIGAAILRRTRITDITARYSNKADEFLVMVNGSELAANMIAEGIMVGLEEELANRGLKFPVHLDYGISYYEFAHQTHDTYRPDDTTALTMLQEADIKMYKRKHFAAA
jgi:diguanylate cyclase (GGDEF)-like protein